MQQAGEHGLVGRNPGTLAGQYARNCRDLDAVFPHSTEVLINGVMRGLEHLFHHLAGDQVAYQFAAESGDNHIQAVDFVSSTVKRGVCDLYQARRQGGILGDNSRDLVGVGILVIDDIPNSQGNLGQGGEL